MQTILAKSYLSWNKKDIEVFSSLQLSRPSRLSSFASVSIHVQFDVGY